MSPNKLFDYLDGKLPAAERAELETRLAIDSVLQRELAIARKIHAGMPGGSHEVIGSLESASNGRGAILGRRVALAFIVLVFVNVLIGLGFIFQKERKPADAKRDAGIRQQLEQSLGKAAASALPTPNLETDEIKIIAPALQDEAIANQVIAAATAAGGSGAKALSDESGIVVLVDVPKSQEEPFRKRLVPMDAHLPAIEKPAQPSAPNERKFLQVRIVRPSAEKEP
jgi:anti-sigma factor RsiW